MVYDPSKTMKEQAQVDLQDIINECRKRVKLSRTVRRELEREALREFSQATNGFSQATAGFSQAPEGASQASEGSDDEDDQEGAEPASQLSAVGTPGESAATAGGVLSGKL